MDEQFYNEYFEGLATRSNDINHDPEATRKGFFVINDMENLREVEEAIRQSLAKTALLAENFEDELADNNADNNMQKLHGAIAVIIRTGNDLKVRDAIKQARAIARKLIFKMGWDARSGSLSELNIIVKLSSNGFPVGPVADGCYGWRYTFTWTTNLITALDPADFKS